MLMNDAAEGHPGDAKALGSIRHRKAEFGEDVSRRIAPGCTGFFIMLALRQWWSK